MTTESQKQRLKVVRARTAAILGAMNKLFPATTSELHNPDLDTDALIAFENIVSDMVGGAYDEGSIPDFASQS